MLKFKGKFTFFNVLIILNCTNLFVGMNNEIVKVTLRCPIRTTIDLLGGKWKLLILFQLSNRRYRLSELKRQIPDISEKMLIQELKNLIDSNLVNRINFGEVPPRVEYEITEIGLKALPLISEMRNFAIAYEDFQKI
jgi:DNA-binding HxlR family transcriptional regulator